AYAKDKIFFPTEFLHGLYDGGHGAGLEDYWNIMWNKPLHAGGFLWDFADEAVVRTDKNGMLDTDGNHAADGIVGPYGEKEASYFTIKEIWSPIFIEDRFIRDDFNGIFRVENRYHFTGLDACSMTAKWVKFEGPEGASEYSILSQNKVELPNLAPGAKGIFEVEKPQNWKSADALHLTATDPHGKEIFTWSYPVKMPQWLNKEKINYTGKGKIKTEIKDAQIYVAANGVDFTFSEKTGLLLEVKKGGKVIPLNNGPIILGQNDKMESVKLKKLKDKVEITALFEETDKHQEWVTYEELSADLIKWTVYPNGALDLLVEMKGKKKVKNYKGITFSFPEPEVAGKKWLGDGPYRVWRNRMKGTRFQVWENDYNNTITGESGFVYPEFKGFFSNLYWAKVKGKNNNGFTVYCHSPHTYLRMFTPDQPAAPKRGATVKNFPAGDISFVKNIPAIGSKFQEAELMGPHGNSENFFGNDDEPIRIKLTFEF
ncbi:MAG: beta-galactosidase, partial [Calditrichaeota bacterium]